ncbi:MAG: glycosyltransferase [Hydrogeniiclostridium mannosilyticum]
MRNFHLPYLRAFCEHGWIVHVACSGPEAVIPDAHEVILPFRKKMLAAENLQAARTLRRMMEEEQYDLISTHTSLAAFFTRVAVKGMKKGPLWPVWCMDIFLMKRHHGSSRQCS